MQIVVSTLLRAGLLMKVIVRHVKHKSLGTIAASSTHDAATADANADLQASTGGLDRVEQPGRRCEPSCRRSAGKRSLGAGIRADGE